MVLAEANLGAIIARVDELERQIKLLKESLDELKDLELIGKMDVINLKNEVESVEMGNPDASQRKENARDLDEMRQELEQIRMQLSSGGLNVCRNCGTVIASGSKFCGKCGGKA